ncbi:exodeoxyribonuclease V subunit gamma [Vandammella animalimorsus]|uniref:RecBCD enzyme subunit RecC n=1 Tax=Vandammella animalimorsus TaxID=2029117 RepID=A0A2A2ASX8_9BURK|nr:exodeoxyribonuclease V subunit gamma [Vandammella animalimorsus]
MPRGRAVPRYIRAHRPNGPDRPRLPVPQSPDSTAPIAPTIAPGIVSLHSNRTEALAQALAAWMRQHPLQALEQEVALVQSQGMGEWLKMALARQLGISAAVQMELPSRFAWRMYRRILGPQQVPQHTPLDKADMLWRLMRILPALLGEASAPLAAPSAEPPDEPIWQPLRQSLQAAQRALAGQAQEGDGPAAPPAPELAQHALYQLALRIADLFDQYQVYRPDWLQDWAQGREQLAPFLGGQAQPLPPAQRWQAALWRALLHSLDAAQQQAIRPRLHQRALAQLAQGGPAQPLPRRIMLFGASHLHVPVLELLTALGQHAQVLLAVPNPCQMYWSDAVPGRELFARLLRQTANQRRPEQQLAAIELSAMHAHANPLLTTWGRQVRDFVRLLEHYEQQALAQQQGQGLPRIDLYDTDTEADIEAGAEAAPSMLRQVQEHIRDLLPLSEPLRTAALAPQDRSICFQIAHSPVRELEALHTHLLELMLPGSVPDAAGSAQPPVAPREIVVMVPDIAQYAPLIRAVFGQYGPQDARHIPFAIADLGAQAVSPLVQAVEWLSQLPQQRASLSQLSDLLAVPAVAQRLGLDDEGVATLQAWMQGSGIRWGLDEAHRQQLGLAHMGAQNSAWFGLQRMLLGYASQQGWGGLAPYEEIGGLAAGHVGALAHLVQRLQHWQHELGHSATPLQWGQRWRALLADFFQPASEADQAALQLLEQALQQWLDACLQAGCEQPLALPVARHAWLARLQGPEPQQRFHAGGVTFCTLLPMRAIPFRIVCLLGMDEGVYPRRATPNAMDLMRLPGQQRPGDRSRTQDDRQLMLEALLSARQQLLISWVGKSVRDNTPRPPSVLVAQLRDYLSARWSAQAVAERTTEHPLQPFNPRYFLQPPPGQSQEGQPQPDQPLPSWAWEWHPQPGAQPQAQDPGLRLLQAQGDAPAAPTTALAATPAVTARPWSVAELAAIWRHPVPQWFAIRLQTRFAPLDEQAEDCEPLAIDGLQRWQIFEQLLQRLRPLVEQSPPFQPEALRQALQHELERIQRRGDMPLGAWAEQLQQQWLTQWQWLLQVWQASVRDWPQAQTPARRLRWSPEPAGPAQPQQPWIEDWAPPWRCNAAGDALVLHLQPGQLQASSGELRLHRLLRPWLQSCLLAACASDDAPDASAPDDSTDATAGGRGPAMRVLALDGVLDIAPIPAGQAQAWLHAVLTMAAQALSGPQPLPLDFDTALAWWNALHKAQSQSAPEPEAERAARSAARQAYDGGHQRTGSAQRQPALARAWPDFAALQASGAFESWARQWLQPLHDWLEQYVQVHWAQEEQGAQTSA